MTLARHRGWSAADKAARPKRDHRAPSAAGPRAPAFLQRKAACACGGSCPRCQQNQKVGLPLQAKLEVSQPGDALEQEADRVAEQVLRMPQAESSDTTEAHGSPALSLSRYASDTSAQRSPEVPPIVHDVVRSPGEPLDPATRVFMEPRLGQDFGAVRIHTNAQAVQSARAIDALAYTAGSHIVFGEGRFTPATRAGQRLLAHELTHVVQQRGTGAVVQRYEAGEHAKMGETQAELKALFAPISYTVLKNETLASIAQKFGITVAGLRDANKDKLRRWPASDGSGRTVEGFNAGEIVAIPQKLNVFAQAALKDPSAKVTVNGEVMDYGVAIAMGDFFENPTQMATAPPKEIHALATLIEREQSGGAKVDTMEWELATGGRYLKLAEKNVEHFAPPNKAFVAASSANVTAPNHKTEWEKYHKEALDASVAGDKNKALMLNAFADHFLTDAFAAGHLVNKRDVMEQFKGRFTVVKGDFDAASVAYFAAVAKDAYVGSVATEFAKHEAVKTFGKPNISNASRFSLLLQGVHMARPDLMANAVTKGLHDKLNTMPGGLPVDNKRGDPPWNLSGDGTLNNDTLQIAKKAVAQSQANVITAYMSAGPLDYPRLYRAVWDYTPQPTTTGAKQLVDAVTKGTDIANLDLIKAVVDLIKTQYLLIIAELVRLGELQKK